MTILADRVDYVLRDTDEIQPRVCEWSTGVHSGAACPAALFISVMTRPMPQDFENKVALVTGASRGIGRAVAVRFAEGGAKVAIAYAGNDTAANEAKAGLIGFTKSLARELGSRNIRVNAVSPGLIETDMTKELPEAAKKAMAEGASLGRAGTAREVAEAIAFLGSDRASFITGEVLRVNGGLYM